MTMRRDQRWICFNILRRITVILVSILIASCGSSGGYSRQSDTHIVRQGETLYSIAFRYDQDPADVARWNNLGDGSLIYPGQVLRIPPIG